MNIQIPDHVYQKLLLGAQWRGTTPEALLESLIAQLPAGYAKDEEEFFHALGFDDSQIAEAKERAKLLPADPDW